MKINSFPLLLALVVLPVVTASAQLVGYTNASKVDLLSAYNASMSMSGTNDGSTQPVTNARFYLDDSYIAYDASPTPAATLDFGAVRNVQTLTIYDNFTSYGFTAATVETSNDGSSWSAPVGNVVTNPNGATTLVTLNSAVDARYVRLTPTALDNSRWIYNVIRAFSGNTGAMAGDTNLSIIANGGLSATQSISMIGSVDPINASQIIAPATVPLNRQLLYDIGNGDGFKLDLGQTFSLDRGSISLSGVSASATLTLSGSTDGTNFAPLYTQIFTPGGYGLFNFSFTQADARYLNITFETASPDIRVSDFAFFQANPVPEPQTWALAALGASAVFLRLRRRHLVG